ncbi:MAG: hypothetical protein ACRDG4_04935, partial [Chloroflexota bacterium]
MPRRRGAWYVLPSRRALIGFALGRSALGALSLGACRPSLPEPTAFPDGPLGMALRPHQRRLWRGRALHVLTRTFSFAAGWLFVAALISRQLGETPPALFWIPAACCLLAGMWFGFAQRPTALETARLLDRRFRLRDVLGTAVEISGQESDRQLYHKQIAYALALLKRAPSTPWAPAPRREWLLAVVPAALSVALIAGMPHQSAPIAAASHGAPGAATRAHPLALAQTAKAPSVSGALGLNQPGSSPSRVTTKARIPTLSLSLQIHAAPPGEQSSTTGTGPYLTGGSLGAGAGGTTGKGAQGANGTAGKGNGVGQGQQGTGGSPQTGVGQGNTGQSGAGGQGRNGLQSPQSGQQNTTGQNGQPGPAGSNQPNQGQIQDQTPGQGGPQPGNAGTDAGAPTGPNPFGQDKPSPGNHSAGTAKGTPSGQAGKAKQSPGAASGKGSTASGKSAGQAPNGTGQDDLPDGLRRGRSGTQLPSNQNPNPATHKAGPASGPQVTLGGHYVISPGDQGQGLVRIAPQGSAAGNGLQGAGYAGSATVQG